MAYSIWIDGIMFFYSNADAKPRLKDINKYVRPYAKERWYDIGIELEVGDDEGKLLDDIKKRNDRNDLDCFLEMITVWVRSGLTSVSWKTLLQCLRELELQEAVASLESKIQGEWFLLIGHN